jgi:cytochrome c-type biogenesis protein CcmH
MKKILVVTLLIIILAGAFASAVFAQTKLPTDDDVNRVAKQLYCPVCESTPLDVCPTEACRQWRDVIRTMLTEGKSEAEIKQYFVAQYGVRVLNVPPNPWATYFIPAVVILIGAALLFRGFQLWKRPLVAISASDEQEAQPVQQDEYLAKMEEELRKRK